MVVKAKSEWAKRLAVAIKGWCTQNKYSVRKKLAEELGISSGLWEHLMKADTIAADPEVYAKIYQRTRLSEADPRTVPPYRHGVGKSGIYKEVGRAWTDEQLQEWLASKGAGKKVGDQKAVRISPRFKREQPLVVPEVILDEVQEAGQTPTPSPPTAQPTLGHAIDGLTSIFASQICRQIADEMILVMRQERQLFGVQLDELKAELASYFERMLLKTQDQRVKSEPRTITRLANQLTRELQSVAWGTPEDRDSLMREHGQALVDLETLLYPLIQPSDEREKILPLNREQITLG